MSFFNELSKDLLPLKKDRFLLAVSGGLDSLALLAVFKHFREHFNFYFSVVHFHHGPCEEAQLLDFRFNAFALVKRECEKNNISFYSNYSDSDPEIFIRSWGQALESENDCRQARYQFFDQLMEQEKFDWLALGHHRDDLLETRLMRMIRGVGPEGLRAMSFKSQNRLRPLISLSRKELKDFLKQNQGSWLEDPSNESLDPLRNWLRKKWLPELEDKNPGALGAIARSLDLLVSHAGLQDSFPECIEGETLVLAELLTLSLESKRQVIAAYMKGRGLKNYGLSHINEVLKRLDTEKKSHTFRLLGHSWSVDAGRMSVQGLG